MTAHVAQAIYAAYAILDPLYGLINKGLSKLGIDFRVDSVADLGTAAFGGLVMVFVVMMFMHLVFDD